MNTTANPPIIKFLYGRNFLRFERGVFAIQLRDSHISQVIVMKRKTDIDTEVVNKYMNLAYVINTPSIEISATNIRNRIQNGKSIDYLVPRKVKEYIQENNLYTKKCL